MNLTAFVLMVSLGPQYGSGWTAVDSAKATGFEQIAGGAKHPFSIARSGSRYAYSSERGVDGELFGYLRTEVINADGAFTWLSANPKAVLRLPRSSAPEFVASVAPIEFSPADLAGKTDLVQRRIGKKVKQRSDEEISGRDCLVFEFVDKTPLDITLWVDRATGVPLRELDKVGSEVLYERMVTSFKTGDEVKSSDFEPDADATYIRGLVSPSILLQVARRTRASYDADLNRLRLASEIESGSWIRKIAIPPAFEYVGSTRYESPGAWSVEPSQPQVSQGERTQEDGYGAFVGVPQNLAVPGGVVFNGSSVYFGFNAPSNEFPRNLAPDIYGGIGYPEQSQSGMLPFSGYVGADGSIVVPDPTAEQGATPRPTRGTSPQARRAPAQVGSAFVRSEFLDRKTGDTFTFVQMRNMNVAAAFPGFRLPPAKDLSESQFSGAVSYEIRVPFHLYAVAWQRADSAFVIASTKLEPTELIKFAEAL